MTAPHLFVAALDPVSAKHLARAIDSHRRWCRDNGHHLPPALADLAFLATAGQERTNPASAEELGEGAAVPTLLTFAEAGDRLRLSERTVRRLVDAGRLPAVEVASKRRIHAEDLAAFADALRHKAAPA